MALGIMFTVTIMSEVSLGSTEHQECVQAFMIFDIQTSKQGPCIGRRRS